jgi:hypothetical protein
MLGYTYNACLISLHTGWGRAARITARPHEKAHINFSIGKSVDPRTGTQAKAKKRNPMFCWTCISIYACNGTNLMHCLSSVYPVTTTLDVSGLLLAHYQLVTMYVVEILSYPKVIVAWNSAMLHFEITQHGDAIFRGAWSKNATQYVCICRRVLNSILRNRFRINLAFTLDTPNFVVQHYWRLVIFLRNK